MTTRITISGTSPVSNVFRVGDHYEIFGDTNPFDRDDIFYFRGEVPTPAGGLPSITFGGAGDDLVRSPNGLGAADYYGGVIGKDAAGRYLENHKAPPGMTNARHFALMEDDGDDEFDLGEGDHVTAGGGQDRVNFHIAGSGGYSTPGYVRGLSPFADGEQVGGPRAEGDVISAPHNRGFTISNVKVYNSETVDNGDGTKLYHVQFFDILCRDNSFRAGPTVLSDHVNITMDMRSDMRGVGVNHITGERTPGQTGGDDFQLWLTTDPNESVTRTIFEWVREHDAEYNPGGPDYQINPNGLDFFV